MREAIRQGISGEGLRAFTVNQKESAGWTYAPRLSEAARVISTLTHQGKAKLLTSEQWGHGIRLFPDSPEMG
eukprot:4550725-Prorocentrum_lima.AAC.1